MTNLPANNTNPKHEKNMTTQNTHIAINTSPSSIPSNNPEKHRSFINNLSEGVIFTQGIDPYSSNLVAIFGNGKESDNKQAITKWVNKTITQSGIDTNEPMLVFNQLFRERIEEVTGVEF